MGAWTCLFGDRYSGPVAFCSSNCCAINETDTWERAVKNDLFCASNFISGCIRASVSKFLQCNPDGIINALLRMIGLDALAQPWLGQASTSLVTVALIECYKYMGLYVVILYSALISISSDVIESAMIDGATGWTMFCKIKLPLISNVFVATLVMVVNGSLKAFDLVYITTNGGPGNSSELTATYMYRMAFTATKYGYGSAIAVFMAIQSILIVFVIRRAFSFTNRLEG